MRAWHTKSVLQLFGALVMCGVTAAIALARQSSNTSPTLPSDPDRSQETPSAATNELGPQTYRNAEKPGLDYVGTPSPRNVLLFDLDFQTIYDNNIFANNQQRIGDVEFLIGPRVSLRREGNRFNVALDYRPYFWIYRNEADLNEFNQAVVFDASYRATPRLSFRARVDMSYTNSIFQPSQNEAFLPSMGLPSSLNETLYSPTARQLSLSSRIDAGYQVGRHDTISLYVDQSLLNFERQTSGNLQNTRETDAGLQYQRQLSPHATAGVEYLFQDILYGPESRTLVNSIFLSHARQLSPSVAIAVFGGPQYATFSGTSSVPFPSTLGQPAAASAGWNWGLGVTITKRLKSTVFQFKAGRQITNGGGLFLAAVSTSAGISIRQRLPGRWDALGTASYANNNGLSFEGPATSYDSVIIGLGVQRPLTNRLDVRFGYDHLRQWGMGQAPLIADINRDLVSVQFSYRIRERVLNR